MIARTTAAHALAVPALALVLLAPGVSVAADAPDWLQQAARLPSSRLEAGAGAVVLADDVTVSIAPDGRVVTRRLYAVRVLRKEGADAASLREVYVTGSGEVRAMRAWLLRDGRSLQLGKPETADAAIVDNDMYSEVRVRVMSAVDRIEPGDVFGAESETVDRSVFTQLEWRLQEEHPVRRARRVLTLPSGWDARWVTLNRPPMEPEREGGSLVWSVQDLPRPPREPAGPPPSALVPRIAVSYFDRQRRGTAFEDWPAVSRWLAGLQDPQAAVTSTLSEKARQLATGAETDLDKIAAIGRYVQRVQYISIQTGLGRGGGYKPHLAAEVLAKNYGDCKDKANLMRALLASIGIRSHLVAIYAGDPEYVRTEWPSPQQFNHAIIAVTAPAGTRLPALGAENAPSLVFFDPTDDVTPFGELPMYLQGSLGLLVTAEGGSLVRMPVTAPDANQAARVVQATVSGDGTLTATVRHTSAGDPATMERQLLASLSKDGYLRRLESDIRRQIPGATLAQSRVAEDAAANRFELTLQIEARGYAQVLQQRLMLIRAPQSVRTGLPTLIAPARATPVLLDPRDERDRFELELPAGASVDEMPPPRRMEAPFGHFSVQWTAEGRTVVRAVELRVSRTAVQPADYPRLRAFLDAFREAERQPIVLTR